MTTATQSSSPLGSSNARERLKALKARRSEVSANTPAVEAPEQAAGGGARDRLKTMLGTGQTAQRRRKMMMQVYGLLTKTEGTDTKMIPGTPFSEDGVEKLMDMLRTRAAREDQAGAKAAGLMLAFLTAKDEDDQTVAGASVAKLRVLAQASSKLRRQAT